MVGWQRLGIGRGEDGGWGYEKGLHGGRSEQLLKVESPSVTNDKNQRLGKLIRIGTTYMNNLNKKANGKSTPTNTDASRSRFRKSKLFLHTRYARTFIFFLQYELAGRKMMHGQSPLHWISTPGMKLKHSIP